MTCDLRHFLEYVLLYAPLPMRLVVIFALVYAMAFISAGALDASLQRLRAQLRGGR